MGRYKLKGGKMDTINVVEIKNDDITGLASFEDSDKGMAEAKELFVECAKDNGARDGEIPAFLEDKYFETGTYQIFLTRST